MDILKEIEEKNSVLVDGIIFTFTKDKSVGLYDKAVGDIYHSIYGAKDESREKFIKPLTVNKNFYRKKNMNILDICYGIGYNTKSFLEKYLNLNCDAKLNIDILENDKKLVLMSPFIKDRYFKSNSEISYLLIRALFDEIENNSEYLYKVIDNNDIKKYFEPYYVKYLSKYTNKGYRLILQDNKNRFLHNIYYHCVSRRNKTPYNCRRINNITITPYIGDARTSVQTLKKEYDAIFLDAFTPAKLPTLWSIDFFNELYKLSSYDCMLLTYSTAASVRNAMVQSGFYIGKILDKNNKPCGTVATKNKLLIEHELSHYEIKLLETKAGIFYEDKYLSNIPQEILKNHELKLLNSNLESSSHFVKKYNKEKINA